MLIVAFAVLVVLIILLISALTRPRKDNVDVNAPAIVTTESPTAEPLDATDAPTAEPTAEPTKTPEPLPTPTPAPTANNIADAAHAANRPEPTPGWLPIFQGAQTNEKIVAITVDDCFQADNLKKIIDCAIENNGKLTIFPIGKNAVKSQQAAALKYAWENGFELENHTMTHNGLYRSTDEELAQEVYWQSLTLDQILGVNYQVHFLRPKGGDARADQRIHAYISQLGYYGVAHWSYSGSGNELSALKKSLKPGQLYLFHTTDKDLEKLLKFIPYCASQGYKMVTMNEMYGYPANEVSELTVSIDELHENVPPLEEYTVVPVTYKKGNYAYGVYHIQERLKELGYLHDESDGCFGGNTQKAVKNFQKKAGLEASGVADIATQEKLFADDAPHA